MNDRKFLSDNIKAVILDFDGTVGNSRGLIVRTMQQTIRRLGCRREVKKSVRR